MNIDTRCIFCSAVDRTEVYINQGIPERLLAGVSGQLIFAECHDYVSARKSDVNNIL